MCLSTDLSGTPGILAARRKETTDQSRPTQAGQAASSQPGAPHGTSARTTKIRVLVADDDAIVRGALVETLNRNEHIQVVAVAADGREALQKATDTKPDVAVLDWFMPCFNGFDAALMMTAIRRGPRAILLSAFHQDSHLVHALRCGVPGYLRKEEGTFDELPVAILEVARGNDYVSSSLSTVVAAAMESGQARVRETRELTQRERQVVQLLAEGRGSKETAEILGVSVNTIASHRESIGQKLDIRDVAGLIRYAIRNGLIRP